MTQRDLWGLLRLIHCFLMLMSPKLVFTASMMNHDEYHFFIDDTGSRVSHEKPNSQRQDGVDCFGLGGILIKQEDISVVWEAHKNFCTDWKIDYPLHSHKIRGARGDFSWLKNPEKAVEFLPALSKFLCDLPVLGLAAVIDRPGYIKRYHDAYDGSPWLMDRTAMSILTERAAKFAKREKRHLRIFFEQSGKHEDRDIIRFVKDLKTSGMPFSNESSSYGALSPEDFKRIIRGEPRRKTKKTAPIQIADLYLYPMAKGAYDPTYRSYRELMEACKLIDAVLDDTERLTMGIKYSCFEDVWAKQKGSGNPDP